MFLKDIQSIRPENVLSQEQAIEWLSCAHAHSEFIERNKDLDKEAFYINIKTFFERFGIDETQIFRRGTVLKDLTHTNWEAMDIFKIELDPRGISNEDRLAVYSIEAEKVINEFYQNVMEAPANIFHVTCTGYASPSCAQKIVGSKHWGDRTQVMHIYHMGCHAAITAIRIGLGQTEKGKSTDVIHTEICSLYLDPSLHDPEQLILQSIFADGFIKYSFDFEQPERGFRVVSAMEKIVSDSEGVMTYVQASPGMAIMLSQGAMDLMSEYVLEFVVKDLKLALHELKDCVFAIHPAGPRIIESLQQLLRLNENQVIHSQQVLFENGNMASATLPYIWKNILEDKNVKSGTIVISLAIGHGLTVAGAIFEKI